MKRKIAMAATAMAFTAGTVAATSGPVFATDDAATTALVQKIVDLSNTVNNSTLAQATAGPIIQVVKTLSLSDWEQVLFGTGQPSSYQVTVGSALVPSIEALATFTATSDTQASALVNQIATQMNTLNPAVSHDEAVQFMTAVENGSINAMAPLLGQSPVQKASVVTQLQGLLSSAEASGGPDVVTLFSSTGPGAGAGAGGAEPVSGQTPGQGTTDSGFSTVLNKGTVGTTGGVVKAAAGQSQIQVSVPANAFGADQNIEVTTGDTSSVQKVVPSGFKPALLVGVHFDDTVAPTAPITVTITSPDVTAHAQVYKVTATGLKLVPSQAANGTLTLSFTSDPDFVIVNPAPLAKGQRAIYFGGAQIAVVPGLVRNGTTYMPIWYVMKALNTAGFVNSWDGKKWTIKAPSSAKANLTGIKAGTGSKGIYLNGTLIQKIDSVTAIDPSSGNSTTYMPIWYVMQVLKRAGVTAQWDGTFWDMTMTK